MAESMPELSSVIYGIWKGAIKDDPDRGKFAHALSIDYEIC